MYTSIAVWSLVVNPGTKETVVPPPDIKIHVKGISLGAELKDTDGRSSLKLSYELATPPAEDDDDDDEKEDGDEVNIDTKEVILGSLTPGKIEQFSTDLVLDDEDEYIFEVIGKNQIHVIGNYIRDPSLPWGDEDESDDEDAFHLGEVSSDVEVDLAELDGIGTDDDELEDDSPRFEEIAEEPKTKKRSAEKMDVDEKPSQPTKAEKKAAKKQKGENGVAIPKEDPVKEAKEDKKDEKKEKKKEKKEKKKEGKVAGEVKELEGGVKIKDVKVGDGPGAQKGQSVKMRYIGKLTNGKLFDSNTKGKPFVFRIGAGEVIKGWDVGIVGMKAGGERELTIPAPMGYGRRKMTDIPPNSTLKFEVRLISIN